MECYVDDIIIKSMFEDHIAGINECFETLRKKYMKVNPINCTYGVSSGKFLGHMVSPWGIEANPKKIKAIINIEPLKTIWEVQKLIGMLASLKRFSSGSTEKGLPLFKVLQRAKEFSWNEDCDKFFEEVKDYLAWAPLLMRPNPKETLQLYLVDSDHMLGAVLVKIHEGNLHQVFYFSHMLKDAETRYLNAEKIR